MTAPLVLLGCGYTLTRLAVAEARAGRDVLAATRDAARRAELERAGARVTSLEDALTQTEGARVVSSVPPDAGLDTRIAEALARNRPSRLVYLSSTGVYGGARGHVDEDTPVEPASPSARARIEAESCFLPLGAVVLRIAGIYGPERSPVARLLAGAVRLPESGGGRISRIHVDDLVEAIRVALQWGEPGAFYCVADDRPAPQAEPVAWLCERLGMPLPPRLPLDRLHESVRGDRAVSNARLKTLGWRPRYPDYVAGYTSLLESEGRAGGPGARTVRKLRPDEAETFWTLRLRGLKEHPEAFGASYEEDAVLPMERVRSRLEGPSQWVLGAFDGERLVGVAGLYRDTGRKQSHKAHVWGMYVLPEVRSRGIGRRLMSALLDEARRMPGVERLLLTVAVGNASAQKLYRALGFRTYGVEPNALRFDGASVDNELMCMPL
ncbi:GNAT family N-acetyltransferase [Pyxidicoccus trucidator]|uniref:GNAT family N-acetyltransferase n=1 Tax=Pyxidicoccus trucidator TaxID=2709662 RepID=UPI0013DBD102|nr:GNAT family N-acetyltransferase [Pyxidicoccus trucidator]